MREYHPSHGEDKRLHERMVELPWDGGDEEQHRKPEGMDVPPDTDVYLETVETAEDPAKKAEGLGLAGVAACERAYSRKSYWKT